MDQIQTIENIINPPNIHKDSVATSKGEDDNTNIDNHEISMNYVHTRKRWNMIETNVNDIFAYSIANENHG